MQALKNKLRTPNERGFTSSGYEPDLFLEGLIVQQKKMRPGMIIGRQEHVTITGNPLSIPDSEQLVHLQFRRFAGCPVCNLHLRSMARRQDEITRAGIREIVFFHSTADELLKYSGDLPFDIIADPGKRFYVQFGVESSPRSILDLRVWPTILRAVFHSLREIIKERRPVPPINPKGGRYGLPADFLIASDGRVVDCKYGVHADDHWSVDELLGIARSYRAISMFQQERSL